MKEYSYHYCLAGCDAL